MVGTLFFGVVLYIVVVMFSQSILSMIAPGFYPSKLALANKLLTVMSPAFILMATTEILAGYQQANAYLKYASSNALVFNLITIGFIIFLALKEGIYAMAEALLISSLLQFFVQIYGSYRSGLWNKLGFKPDLSATKKFWCMILPLVIGIALSQLSTVIDRIFASALPNGSISALNYAYKLHWLAIAFLILPLTTAFYPVMAQLLNTSWDGFREQLKKITSLITFVALPVSLFASIMAEPIVSAVFLRGAFDKTAALATSGVMVYFLLGLVFQVLVIFFLDITYVLQKTSLALLITVVMAGSNIGLNCLFVVKIGALGLTLVTSIYQVLAVYFYIHCWLNATKFFV